MKNLRLIIFVVAIFKLSLISTMELYKSKNSEEQQFDALVQKYKNQIAQNIPVEDLILIIEEYTNFRLDMEEQSQKLYSAIINSNFKEMQKAIENCAPVNFKYNSGDTPLTLALKTIKKPEAGFLENLNLILTFVKYLIKSGADVNAKDDDQNNSVIIAFKENLLNDIIGFLIQNGADLNTQNLEGQTALIIAVKDGNYDLIKNLIGYGAKLKIKDIHGKTAYDYALARYTSGLERTYKDKYKQIMDLILKGERVEAKREEEDKELQEAITRSQQQEMEDIRAFYAKEERKKQEEARLRAQRAQEAMEAAVAHPQEEEWAEEPAPEEAEDWGNVEQED